MKEPAPPTLSLRLVRLPSGVEKLIDGAELLLLKEVDLRCHLEGSPPGISGGGGIEAKKF